MLPHNGDPANQDEVGPANLASTMCFAQQRDYNKLIFVGLFLALLEGALQSQRIGILHHGFDQS
jgi:hypothetical protein